MMKGLYLLIPPLPRDLFFRGAAQLCPELRV